MGLIKKGIEKFKESLSKDEEYDDEVEDFAPPLEADNSRWELETEDQLVNFEQTLRGKKKASDGKKWIPIVKGDKFRPLMNDYGITSLLGLLRMLFQKHNALGHIDKHYLNIAIIDIMDVVIDNLAMNRVTWEVEKTNLDLIRSLFEHQVYIFLTRSVDGAEKKYRGKRYPMKEMYKHDEVSPDEIAVL